MTTVDNEGAILLGVGAGGHLVVATSGPPRMAPVRSLLLPD
jgi:hypothetical protein